MSTNKNTNSRPINVGVHAAHCCERHDCKYNYPECPVKNGTVKQKYGCEYCDDEFEEVVDHSYHGASDEDRVDDWG